MKNKIILVVAVIACTFLNFSIFMFAYKKLIFPLLHEDQRMDVAPSLFSYVLPSFFASSIIVLFAVFFFLNKKA